MQPASPRPFNRWYAEQFPELENVPIRILCYMSILAVHRRHVLQHPVARYAALRDQLNTHPNPEVGHYVERAWGAIFWPYPEHCVHDY